jgi:hypothetical protein
VLALEVLVPFLSNKLALRDPLDGGLALF